MEHFLSNHMEIIIVSATAFATAFAAIPVVIYLSRKKNLLDKPDQRKQHKEPIPTMGGVGVFAGLVASATIWTGLLSLPEAISISFAITMLLVTGVVDDLKGLSPLFRLCIQCIAAIVAVYAGFIIHLPNVFHIDGMFMTAFEYGFTIIVIAGVTNAFNLIDGIDGLAGGLGFINATLFGFLFLFLGNEGFAILAFAFAASLLAFLKYNFNPARIFMGDTGSLVLGYLMIVFAIKAINLSSGTEWTATFVLVVFSMLLVPVIDTMRVFLFRILKKKSPFSADRTHIHHLLLKTGFDHKKASFILCAANIILIVEAYLLRWIQIELSILILLGSALFLIEILSVKRFFKIRTRINVLYHDYRTISDDNLLLLKYLNTKKKI